MAPSTPPITLLDSKHALQGSWVSPNAKCPVCGSPVYFYCSPDGGGVYFDELGPPWPKHPCTDQTGSTARPSVPAAKRWDKIGWQPMVDFQVSLIAGKDLYRIIGSAVPYERRLLFRLDGSFDVEMVRFNEKQGVQVELSLLARDRTTGEWLICEGVGKIAPNFPPSERLRVVQRTPNAPERFKEEIRPIDDETLVVTGEPYTLPPQAQSPGEPGAVSDLVPLMARVEKIDERIRNLLTKIEELNDEKSRLFRTAMSPSDEPSH